MTVSLPLTLKEPARNYVIGAWLIAAALLLLVLRFDLLPALLAGLLVFELVRLLTLRLTFVRERKARVLAVAFIGAWPLSRPCCSFAATRAAMSCC